jgi:uncharacterized protein (DUF1800 family)
MKTTLAVTLTTLALGAALEARAQCLRPEDEAAFTAALRSNIGQSDWPMDEITLRAFDRLGYGQNPKLADAWDASRPAKAQHLAALIATSLRQAATRDGATDNGLAALTRVPRAAEQSDRPYRYANQSLSQTYADQYVRQQAVKNATTPAARQSAQRAVNLANADLRATAQVRRVAHLMGATNVDLGEVLNEFWLNHFNIDARKATWPATDYQKALRGAQCSTFYRLLLTSAKHPAMSIYLDNYSSRVGNINENYGRELLELHTLGDDQFRYYDQSDVVDVARALTGWAYARTEPAPGTYGVEFRFYSAGHDGAALSLFDSAPEGTPLTVAAMSGPDAVARGERVLRYLAGHPATRRNVCGKLAFLLLGTRRSDIVDGCAADAVWGKLGNLGAVYQYLLSRRELFHSVSDLSAADAARVQSTLRNKVKTPLELVVSAARAAGLPRPGWLTIDALEARAGASSELGLAPAMIAPPTGYPDANTWLSSGYVMRWQEVLFRDLDTQSVTLTVDGTALRARGLENRFRQVLASTEGLPAADANLTLDTWSARLVGEGLNLPPHAARSAGAKRFAFRNPDTEGPTGATQPVRTLLHTYLGSPTFLRK